MSPFVTREKAEKEAAERAKQQQVEESDDGVVVSKVKYTECQEHRIVYVQCLKMLCS